MTALCAHMLVERGLLDLDAPDQQKAGAPEEPVVQAVDASLGRTERAQLTSRGQRGMSAAVVNAPPVEGK
jgi:CubicO group peptidase (beta-lactamase class C family)